MLGVCVNAFSGEFYNFLQLAMRSGAVGKNENMYPVSFFLFFFLQFACGHFYKACFIQCYHSIF